MLKDDRVSQTFFSEERINDLKRMLGCVLFVGLILLLVEQHLAPEQNFLKLVVVHNIAAAVLYYLLRVNDATNQISG